MSFSQSIFLLKKTIYFSPFTAIVLQTIPGYLRKHLVLTICSLCQWILNLNIQSVLLLNVECTVSQFWDVKFLRSYQLGFYLVGFVNLVPMTHYLDN